MTSPSQLQSDFVALLEQVISIQYDMGSITRETQMAADLMMDSISLVSLMALCEEFFQINLQDSGESVAKIETVGDALDLISQLF
jgi:acyl carrier protein